MFSYVVVVVLCLAVACSLLCVGYVVTRDADECKDK